MEKSSEHLNEKEKIEKHRREHLMQYLLLIIVFVFSLGVIYQLENKTAKISAIFVLAFVYLIWGILHHNEEKNITRDHILEYTMISILIVMILFFNFL